MLLLGQGIHPKIVAETLGHTATSITLDLQHEAADTMDRLFRTQGALLDIVQIHVKASGL